VRSELEKKIIKKGWRSGLRCRPEFKPQYCKKKKKKVHEGNLEVSGRLRAGEIFSWLEPKHQARHFLCL
jgi:hypothetical protein